MGKLIKALVGCKGNGGGRHHWTRKGTGGHEYCANFGCRETR